MCSSKKLWFFYGTMSSGKSLRLLATANNFQENSIPYMIIKSNIDTRDGEGVVHSRALKDDTKKCVNISQEDNIFNLIDSYVTTTSVLLKPKLKWILVDEAQFLTEKQVDELGKVADELGIGVMCYGLRTDFQTHLFPGSKRLFEIADTVEEIKSSCSCDGKTIFNARVDDCMNIITDGEQIEIGGNDRYVSMCRKCYYNKLKKQLNRN